jgi:transposase
VTSRAELARRFRIGESTLYRWLEAEREEGRTTAKPHAGGPISRFDAGLLRPLVNAAPDATLGELATRYTAETHAVISVSSVERLVQVLDLRRKKRDAARGGAGPA